MKGNGKSVLIIAIKSLMFILYALLAYPACSLLYEHHFYPGIMYLIWIPDEALLAAFLACCWGIWSTLSVKKLNANYWIKSGIILIVNIYTQF